jgi:hypothetical protein
MESRRSFVMLARLTLAAAVACAALASCARTPSTSPRTFTTPEDAVRALIDAAKASDLNAVVAIFGPDGRELADSSDAATARRSREVFTAAAAEKWQLVDRGANAKELVIGNEEWPFPVPLVKTGDSWHFDTPAGKEEVVARRIGRNELAVMWVSRTYVAAQRLYAQRGHDGRPAGVYAKAFRSDAGRHNGLYWPAARGEKRSPLGDLVAKAAEEGTQLGQGDKPSPFHGYYFRILDGQGAAAPGGAKSYVVNGDMTAGFALVAWPAQYDVTGVMTFIVNQNGVVHEKDLGSSTDAAAKAITLYDPDSTWTAQ